MDALHLRADVKNPGFLIALRNARSISDEPVVFLLALIKKFTSANELVDRFHSQFLRNISYIQRIIQNKEIV